MKVYVVMMYRWGNRENHSYVVGVFSTEEKAIEAAQEEDNNRARKYDPEILEVTIDTRLWTGKKDFKTIIPLGTTIEERIEKWYKNV